MPNIIVAVNDPDERALVIFALRFAGYKVMSAATTEELIALARQADADLLLVDADFGKETPHELRPYLENNAQSIPVIYLVKAGEAMNGQASQVSPLVDTLPKPISSDRLTRKVNARLKKR